MRFHQLAGDSQAQAGPAGSTITGRIHPIKAVKHVRQRFGRYPRPGVRDLHPDRARSLTGGYYHLAGAYPVLFRLDPGDLPVRGLSDEQRHRAQGQRQNHGESQRQTPPQAEAPPRHCRTGTLRRERSARTVVSARRARSCAASWRCVRQPSGHSRRSRTRRRPR